MQARVPSFDTVTPAIYDAEFGGITDGPDTYGPSWSWRFYLYTGGNATSDVDGLTSQNFGSRSKAYKWASVLLGRQPAAGEIIDFDALAGTKCKVAVSINDRGYNVIDEVYPADQPAPQAAPATPQPVPQQQTMPPPGQSVPQAPAQPGGYVPPDERPF